MNIATYMIVPARRRDRHPASVAATSSPVRAADSSFAALVLLVFMVTNFLNFTLVALFQQR